VGLNVEGSLLGRAVGKGVEGFCEIKVVGLAVVGLVVVGILLGLAVGFLLGIAVGVDVEGFLVKSISSKAADEGAEVGLDVVGCLLGLAVGVDVEGTVACLVGVFDGLRVGRAVGTVGLPVGGL
jgi:hypothetical protein